MGTKMGESAVFLQSGGGCGIIKLFDTLSPFRRDTARRVRRSIRITEILSEFPSNLIFYLQNILCPNRLADTARRVPTNERKVIRTHVILIPELHRGRRTDTFR